MEFGLVTLKRIGFFCFPIKHSTHTVTENAPCTVYHDHDACHSESEYLPLSVYACECYADTGGSFCAEARVYSKHWHGFGAVDRIEIAVQEALGERECCLLVLNLQLS